MATRNVNILKTLDWVLVCIYLILLVSGWLSVCGASYDYGDPDFFDFSTRAGKQLRWILCSFVLAGFILLLDDRVYNFFAYLIYAGMMLLLLATPFLAESTKGSYSWLKFGAISVQPAEFAKFATALALAKYMQGYSFSIKSLKCASVLGIIIFLPVLLIIAQRETGSALVYLAFFLVLYREGMSGMVLFIALSVVLYFVIGIRFSEVLIMSHTPLGEFLVLLLIMLFTCLLLRVFTKKNIVTWWVTGVSLGVTLLFYLLAICDIARFNLIVVELTLCALIVGYLLYLSLRERMLSYALIALFTIGSVCTLYSSNYVFENVLEVHQQTRIKVLLGLEEDLTGAGYNVNQSKIAIGSGGLVGKGFLNGTQTKLKYVPEQDTDFIFCTVGEEQGFVGATAVLLCFLCFILRLIYIAERQTSTFGRVYGYSVVSIFLFHLFINIGMVLGLTPVIGIPLPFFSYGGSSLWGFTILLFILLRIDAGRKRRF